jgi:hypothetical protein
MTEEEILQGAKVSITVAERCRCRDCTVVSTDLYDAPCDGWYCLEHAKQSMSCLKGSDRSCGCDF